MYCIVFACIVEYTPQYIQIPADTYQYIQIHTPILLCGLVCEPPASPVQCIMIFEPFPTNFDSPILCILCRTMHSLFLLHRFTLA